MIALIQRVKSASVSVDSQLVASIDLGLLAMIGFLKDDNFSDIERAVNKTVSYRVFEDTTGRMNRSVINVNGELLLVPQFTLGANTKKGNRPDFGDTMQSEMAESFFQQFVSLAAQKTKVQSGIFGAHMEVESINDGPATFIFGY